jgi:hypothetical protein
MPETQTGALASFAGVAFLSDSARGTTETYGIKSISLLVVKPVQEERAWPAKP